MPAGSLEWKINVNTKNIVVADYSIALYSGLSGSYNPSFVYLVRAATTVTAKIAAPVAPTGCTVTFANNKLTVAWKEETFTPIEKLTFVQGTKSVEFILTNFQSSLEITHKDFVNFSTGNVTLSISSAYSSLNGLSGRMSNYSVAWTYIFNAGVHNFSEVTPSITLTKTIPWIVAVGANITISGSASVVLYNSMKVEEPGNVVKTYNLSAATTSTIAAGTTFSKVITLSKAGVYILEVNANTGAAVLNRPIYVGSFLPLTPDFADLAPQTYDTATINAIIAAQPQTIDSLRTNLLYLINAKRGLWGKASLTLDTNLNYLAQNHSNDMVARKFYGHVNPDGLDANGRATKAKLGYGVG